MNLSLVTLVYSDPKPKKDYIRKGRGGAHPNPNKKQSLVDKLYSKRNRLA